MPNKGFKSITMENHIAEKIEEAYKRTRLPGEHFTYWVGRMLEKKLQGELAVKKLAQKITKYPLVVKRYTLP